MRDVVAVSDGMSCGQIALNREGIEYDNYHASEIDKHAIKVTQSNFPNTIQHGDMLNWREWIIDWTRVDLVMGGTPCQGFSFAGKQLAFDDPRSKLLFVFVDIYNHAKKYNPNVKFLLENVRMKKEYIDIISGLMGVEPIKINSALVSPQNRNRLYWTNIDKIEQPEDKGILLSDILQDEVDDKYILTGKWREWFRRNGDVRLRKKYMSLDPLKAICMTARQYANWNGNFVKISKKGVIKQSQDKASCLTGGGNSGGNHSDMDLILSENEIRRLSPVECERLQTVPDNYTESVSDSQRYKMLGNGWTVDVIAHIFKNLNK